MKDKIVFIGVWMMGYMGGIALTGWIMNCSKEASIGPGFLLILYPAIVFLVLSKWEFDAKHPNL